MTVRVGINGFGRIGRNFFRAAKKSGADIDFVAVNDLGSLETMAHLLKYDSVMGVLPNEIKATKTGISVDGDELRVLSERDPKALPWGELGVDVVIESTGIFTKRDTAAYHLEAPAPRMVIVSAPCDGADATFVYGVNHKTFDVKTAPGHLERVVHHQLLRADGEGARRRVRRRAGPDDHDPRLHRRPAARRRAPQGPAAGPWRRDQHRAHLHRRRSGDEPRGRVDEGQARRHLAARPGAHRLDHRLQRHPEDAGHGRPDQRGLQEGGEAGSLKGILKYTEDEIVSSDIHGDPHSCIFDAGLTMSMGTLVKVLGWYDNEWGYSNRLVDLVTLRRAEGPEAKKK